MQRPAASWNHPAVWLFAVAAAALAALGAGLAWLACLIAAGYVMLLLVRVARLSVWSLASLGWPSIESLAVDARFERKPAPQKSGYAFSITYAYLGGDLQQVGSRLRYPFGIVALPGSYEAIAAEAGARRAVRVYFDPKRPERSVLRPGMSLLDACAVALSFACGLPVAGALLVLALTL